MENLHLNSASQHVFSRVFQYLQQQKISSAINKKRGFVWRLMCLTTPALPPISRPERLAFHMAWEMRDLLLHLVHDVSSLEASLLFITSSSLCDWAMWRRIWRWALARLRLGLQLLFSSAKPPLLIIIISEC